MCIFKGNRPELTEERGIQLRSFSCKRGASKIWLCLFGSISQPQPLVNECSLRSQQIAAAALFKLLLLWISYVSESSTDDALNLDATIPLALAIFMPKDCRYCRMSRQTFSPYAKPRVTDITVCQLRC